MTGERNLTAHIEPITVPTDFQQDETGWLADQANTHHLRYLLAHDDDGLIWGQVREGKLICSGQPFAEDFPPLRASTLQQLRLFGDKAELLLWRTETGFAARLLADKAHDEPGCLEENHLLWGNRQEEERSGFVLLAQGKEGLKHAPPIQLDTENELPLTLTVRHYLAYDEDGRAYISASRLVSLNKGGKNE